MFYVIINRPILPLILLSSSPRTLISVLNSKPAFSTTKFLYHNISGLRRTVSKTSLQEGIVKLDFEEITSMTSVAQVNPATENEPLLGRPGDVSQDERQGLAYNLVIGTAPFAQVGVLLLVGLVWGAVFTHQLLVFSLHPLLNSLGALLSIEAILVLQPTHTANQKRSGTYVHAAFNGLAAVSFFTALAVVIWHKQHNHISHFESVHAYLGILIYILLFVQAFIGFTQFFVPGLYGGTDNAKAMYKYHRVSGYVILLMYLVNIVLASKLYYGDRVLHIKTWGTILASVLVVIGVYPRINKQKIAIFG